VGFAYHQMLKVGRYQLVLSSLYLPGMMRLAIGYNWRGNNHKNTLLRAGGYVHASRSLFILSFYNYTLLTILPDPSTPQSPPRCGDRLTT